MLGYRVAEVDTTKILYRAKRDGDEVEIARVMRLLDGNRLLLVTAKNDRLRFRSDDTQVKLKQVEGGKIATINQGADLKVFTLPNHMHLHDEIMSSNRSMLHLSTSKMFTDADRECITLDVDGIINNMLEFIAHL